MNLRKLTGVVATVAPTLATALGGPLAGVAAREIAGALIGDKDASEHQIARAIQHASPQDLVKLKEIELQFQAELEAAGVQLEEIAAKDRASARQRQTATRDWTPSVLGLAIVLGFFGVLAYIFRFGLPDSGSEVLLIMVGSLGTMTTQVGNFFYGSSVGSKTKEEIIADLKAGA
ncbi:hypothetical protein [Litorisediminicola beolgyonensis]|uniref:Uncharacterized protein n=1 Tax=Litorisediminicola beolgyonensis TaxID=1173614 RepID=A0ABW3ZIL6_9RHOB